MSTSYQAYRMSPSLPHVQPSLTYVHQADRMSTKLTEWTPSSVYLPSLLNVYQAYRMSAKLTECPSSLPHVHQDYCMSAQLTECPTSLLNVYKAYRMSTKLTEWRPRRTSPLRCGVPCTWTAPSERCRRSCRTRAGIPPRGQIILWDNGREPEEQSIKMLGKRRQKERREKCVNPRKTRHYMHPPSRKRQRKNRDAHSVTLKVR